MTLLERKAACAYAEYIAADLTGHQKLCVIEMAFTDWPFLKPAIQAKWLAHVAKEST